MWIFLLLIFAGVIYYGIKAIYEHWLQGIRNKIAKDFFEENKVDFGKEREELREKISKLDLSKRQKKRREANIKFDSIVKHSLSLGICPECKKGTLVVRKSIYGKFIGCSRYPLCHYKEGGKKLQERKRGFKDEVNKEIIEDIKAAYF